MPASIPKLLCESHECLLPFPNHFLPLEKFLNKYPQNFAFPREILALSHLRASHITSCTRPELSVWLHKDQVTKLQEEEKLLFGNYEIRNAVLNEEFWVLLDHAMVALLKELVDRELQLHVRHVHRESNTCADRMTAYGQTQDLKLIEYWDLRRMWLA
ncbi:hypothetical protein V6N11_059731 [Hibiscus sabdariffa]|uniref:RNase H type-1 domain-containing protein n=1 Tax=Hibiscus sabdariffa TaxID=183260 RepID=A0ABR2NXY7_9ROSI